MKRDPLLTLSSLFERLVMRKQLPLFLHFILGFTVVNAPTLLETTIITIRENQNPNPQDPVEQAQERTTLSEIIIFFNPFSQGMVNGRPTTSKESIEAMSRVQIGETDGKDGECVVCLEEWELGVVAKEMPRKHRFHVNCIEKWLGNMDRALFAVIRCLNHEELWKKDEAERRELGREIWISSLVRRNGVSNDSSNNVSSSSQLTITRQRARKSYSLGKCFLFLLSSLYRNHYFETRIRPVGSTDSTGDRSTV
ncbi:hypothetical protein K2173_021918 [Erythroxylum novogranatense]|uniref:RING-type E3 ubiquitin transferase n=1 Tax=Erythroxylum novogranatense TaxID=1862640 RepID=A0AAV8T3P2_9ROSI|nr:hypothetical protein K2173_021918 [Erythroxylum novogranatense]